MAIGRDRLKRFVALFVCICCYVVAAILCLFASSGIFPINTNDGSNFLLQALYAAQGLTPYRDYGIVYPPGIALFFGNLLHITDGGVFIRIVWLIACFLLGVNAFLMTRFKVGVTTRLIGSGLITLVATQPIVVLFRNHGSEPFTALLLLTLVLLSIQYIFSETRSTIRLVSLSLCSLCITMVRWDRAFAVACLDFAATGLVFIAAWRGFFQPQDKSKALQLARRMGESSAAIFAGATIALALIAIYAISSNCWSETLWYIFRLPLQVMPYRTLPLPSFDILEADGLWQTGIMAIIVMAGASLYMVANAKAHSSSSFAKLGECLLLLAAPVAMLPYAFGRSDAAHFIPLASMIAGTLIIACIIWNNLKVRLALLTMLVVLFVPLSDQLVYLYSLIYNMEQNELSPFQNGRFQKNLESSTGDCAKLIPNGTHSIFVGHTSYAHFIVSPMILYLARLDLQPATPYIAEDPGIQNTCEYGSNIADDLRRAPRPMIAFLSMSQQWREPNATETMTSCNQIEKFLSETPSSTLGYCMVGSDTMRVVVY